MPAVVREQLHKGTFEGSLANQQQLLADYREDIRKYAEGMDQARIINVFNQIPPQLAKDNKKFQYTLIKEGARSKDYDDVINNLYDNGFIYKSYKVTDAVWPLTTSKDKNSIKLYLNYTGLLKYMLHINKKKYYLNPEIAPVLIENYLASALINMGFSLYYYQSSG